MAGITRFRKEHGMDPEQDEQVEAELTSEDLIEEVSIDGMCGVY